NLNLRELVAQVGGDILSLNHRVGVGLGFDVVPPGNLAVLIEDIAMIAVHRSLPCSFRHNYKIGSKTAVKRLSKDTPRHYDQLSATPFRWLQRRGKRARRRAIDRPCSISN